MRTRRASAEITYNGKLVQVSTEAYQTSFSYEDPASGESDTISLSLADPQAEWIGPWFPSKGDTIDAKIKTDSRDAEGDIGTLDCGKFLLDDFSFSESGSGRAMTISGISAPLDDAFKATEKSKNWENVTLKQIAQTIADDNQMELVYDAEDVTFTAKEQSKKTDSSFLQDLCKTYGKSMKIWAHKLVIFDREAYKAKDAVQTITRGDCTSFSWKTTLAGTYTGGKIQYTNVVGNRTIELELGGGKRILSVSDKADNEEEARIILQAAIDNANHSATTASITIMGDTRLTSGQTILLTGFEQLSGKYYINKKSDSISGSGYTSSLELSLVESLVDVARKEAVKRLASMGVITDPDYWLGQIKVYSQVGDLFVNASAVIKEPAGGYVADTGYAIAKLSNAGIIFDQQYWIENAPNIPQCETLLHKLAGAVEA